MLQMPQSEIDLRERSTLALAFVGDSVLELLVRARLMSQSRLNAGALHKQAVQIVSAKGQFAALAVLMPLLSESEAALVRRGRNASKATVAKHASAEEYRASTGMEALFGWLYLQNETARIETLFEAIWQHYRKQTNKDD